MPYSKHEGGIILSLILLLWGSGLLLEGCPNVGYGLLVVGGVLFSALFFYKVAAGLCVYFIVSGLWSLMERSLIPKPKAKAVTNLPGDGEPAERAPQGWLGRKMEEMKAKMEEVQKQAQNQRQIGVFIKHRVTFGAA